MKVKIPNELTDSRRKELKEHGFDDPDKYRFNDFLMVSLDDHPKDEVVWLRSILDNTDKVKGARAAVRDIDAWLMLQEGGEEPKARSCQAAEGLLKSYINRSPRKHLYASTSDDDGSAALAYYVEKIEYSPSQRDCPPSVSVQLRYNQFGVISTESISFDTSDVQGKTPREILAAKGYQLETVVARDNYEADLANYEETLRVIGREYLAVGVGHLKDDRWYRWESFRMEDDQGNPSRVVVDIFNEGDERRYSSEKNASGHYWSKKERDDLSDEELAAAVHIPEVPVHPYVVVFHLKKHRRVSVHVQNLTRYEYKPEMRDALILPQRDQSLLDVLLADTRSRFQDVVGGKSGGIVVLCQGPPGTGKTLTAEIYAESLQRPLYTVQCSQLGIDAEELEKELLLVFSRAQRWGAIMLLDEADVYVHERGNDLVQNAIVGVFLRVLEYYDGVLFMTTNRGDLVDDAVLSRCTVRITYEVPCKADQRRIWDVLLAANKVQISDAAIESIMDSHDKLSGRDIKNILKLCMLESKATGNPITEHTVDHMRQFKPTMT